MIIAVVNTKGGCGKSTVAINLATAFAGDGYGTLLIDTDEAGTSLEWASRREESQEPLDVVALPNAQALKKNIEGLSAKYTHLVIDGAPKLEELMTISVAVAQAVIIPVIPSPNDLWKLAPMVDLIERVCASAELITGRQIQVRFLVNNYVRRTHMSKEALVALEQFPFAVLDAKLGTRMDYRDSLAQGTSGIESSNRAAQYEVQLLAREVLSLVCGN